MGRTSDPYYEWFGIPLKDQPPNHYRLLGIELFEPTRKVIDTAANRQMSFVKQYQTGEDGELSQRILNELMAARLCLLNREKKAAYDEALRTQLKSPASSASLPTAPSTPPGRRSVGDQAPMSIAATSTMLPFGVDAAPPVCLPTKPEAFPDQSLSSLAYHPAPKYGAVAVCSEWITCPYCQQELALPGSDLDGMCFACPFCLGKFQTISATQDAISPDATRSRESGVQRPRRSFRSTNWRLRITRVVAVVGGVTPGLAALFVVLSMMDQSSEWAGKAFLNNMIRSRESIPSTASDAPRRPLASGESDRVLERASKISGSPDVETGLEANKPASAPISKMPKVTRGQSSPERYLGDVAAKPAKSVVTALENVEAECESEVGHSSPNAVISVSHEENAEASTIGSVATAEQRIPHRSRTPVPDDQSLHHALDRVKNMFEAEYAEAQGISGKKQLAGRLLREADNTRDDAVARYAILRAALDLHLEAEDVAGTLLVVDRVACDFDVNPLLAKGILLRRMSNSASGFVRQHVGELAFTMVEEALEAEQPELAVAFLDLAANVAKSTRDKELVVWSREEDAELRQLAAVMSAVQVAKKTLEQTEDDPDACLVLGEWLCFRVGDWEGGLPLLAKGSNPQLKVAATLEATAPANAAQQKQLADLWFELANSAEEQTASLALKRRAIHWYLIALPKMTGVDRIAVQKALAHLHPIIEKGDAPETPRKEAKAPK